jgi:divalent metal cation (Fe/Co/Zn/Cd) transporter
MHVRKMGFDYFVDIHIEVDGALSVTEGRAHAVKSKLLESNLRIKDGLVHVEPLHSPLK